MPCPGNKLPFYEVYSDRHQRYLHLDLSETPLHQIVPCPTRFNCVIQKDQSTGAPVPALGLSAIRSIPYGEEMLVPARHATGPSGWPYNFTGRVAHRVPADQRNNYCRHLITVPPDAPQEAKDAAQKLLHAFTRGEDWVAHWAGSCLPETSGAGYFILTPEAQFMRELPNLRHLLLSDSAN
ncbi:hypothetical protein WJX73_001654 [Symbiochloris irregularis]|uniref:Uncharacterized protein n=1 Tax=Symbiochloris irregularis TaxID=706552 RepID=A0AAW1NPY4_9CHLO